MHLVYYDESGDDGFPRCSSPLFALSALYLDHRKWAECLEQIVECRRKLKDFVPAKLEIHAKAFLLNKNPYRQFELSDDVRRGVISTLCNLITELPLKIINVVIVKPRISSRKYDVLDTALSYSIQRIRNDLSRGNDGDEHFIIITDAGRVGKMRSTCRRMRRINFVPSRIQPGVRYRQDMKSLIEDPLPKDSKQSYLIQMADLVALLVYLHALEETGAGQISGRMKEVVTPDRVWRWLTTISPRLNLLAAKHPFGIKYHPGDAQRG